MTPEVKKRIEDINNGVVPEGYKRVGKKIIPENWECYKLGDLYVERNERGNDSLQILTVSIHTGVSDGELEEDDLGKKVKRSEDKSVYKHVYSGDVVFNMMRAWQGAIGVVTNEGMVSPAYISAIPNEKIYPMFMNYLLRSKDIIGQINDLSYGVTDFRKRLYWKSFIKVSCQLPSFVEQKKIASILITQDKLISLQEQKVESLKELKKAYLEKMFPKKGSKYPELRFKGFADAWEQCKLSSICKYISSSLTAKDIDENGKYDLYDANSLIGKTTKGCIEEDYITIIKDGAGVGRTRLLPAKSMFLGTMGALVPENSNLDFLYQLTIVADLSKECTGSTIPHIYFKDYGENKYCIPTQEEQQKIGVLLSKLDNLITLQQRKLEAEKKKKNALMQLLLTGKVRCVND